MDYLELDQEEFDFENNIKGKKNHKFFLNDADNTCIVYGEVPMDVRK